MPNQLLSTCPVVCLTFLLSTYPVVCLPYAKFRRMLLCCHLLSANIYSGTKCLNVEGILKFCSSNIVDFILFLICLLRERTSITIGKPAADESAEKLACMRYRFERLDFTASGKHRQMATVACCKCDRAPATTHRWQYGLSCVYKSITNEITQTSRF